MTNDPFVPLERAGWKRGTAGDPRFKSSLRIDPLRMNFPAAAEELRGVGFKVTGDFGGNSAAEVRRFLTDWVEKLAALYMAASLPPTFTVDDNSLRSRVLKECILPVCREQGIPFAMMLGVKKLVNPGMELEGDSEGK